MHPARRTHCPQSTSSRRRREERDTSLLEGERGAVPDPATRPRAASAEGLVRGEDATEVAVLFLVRVVGALIHVRRVGVQLRVEADRRLMGGISGAVGHTYKK